LPEQHSQYLLQLSHNFKPVWAPTKLFGATLIVFLKCISQSVFYFNYTFSGARGRASIESPRQHSQYCLQLSHDFKPIWVPTNMFGATLIFFSNLLVNQFVICNYTFSGARGRANIESPKKHSQYFLQLSHDFKPIWVPTKMFGATLIVFSLIY
jgi:hypothetical protein